MQHIDRDTFWTLGMSISHGIRNPILSIRYGHTYDTNFTFWQQYIPANWVDKVGIDSMSTLRHNLYTYIKDEYNSNNRTSA
jgi:hypothetical protein